MTTKDMLLSVLERHRGEWLETRPAYLGNLAGVVATATPGINWARSENGVEFKVVNHTLAEVFDTKFIAGKSRLTPQQWQVVSLRNTISNPNQSLLGVHHTQHEFPNFDTVFSDRKQMAVFSVLSNETDLKVKVYGGVPKTKTTDVIVSTQVVDLASYVPTAGAMFVNIEIDNDGALQLHVGDYIASKLLATVADIPERAWDRYLIGAVLLEELQTVISNDDIFVPFPLEANYRLHTDVFIDILLGVVDIQQAFEVLDTHTHASVTLNKYRQLIYVVNGDGSITFVSAGGEAVYVLKELEA